jgi:hypothetical protein
LRLIGHLFPEQFWDTAPVKVEGKLPAGSYWTSNPWDDAGKETPKPAGECVGSCAVTLGRGKEKGPAVEGEYSPEAEWSDDDDDDYGDYARSVASDEEGEHDETSSSPHIAAVVAERRYIPPQAAEAPQSETKGSSISHPAANTTPSYCVLKYCADVDSVISASCPPGCTAVRLTREDDMTSVASMAKASGVVEHHGARVMPFGAIPCTGDSQFWDINKLKGKSAHTKHFAHLKLFRELWDNFVLVAEQVLAAGGHISFE